ncbi:hypothetical protein [Bosea sp. FBZP-16]|uniref:head-tail connector protein n=1 Tax=Bosea sp. FBZP-16 TaxID=2065382 RepID=UPI000C30D9D8|nr:hypothetical protein [Bosea sp. FBZP-16]
MPRTVVITPPAALLTPAEIREQLMLPASVSDGVLSRLVKVATQEVDGPDGWLGRALGAQVLEWRGDRFPACWGDGLRLLCQPIGAIVSVSYDDADGLAQTLDSADYEKHGDEIFARRGFSWPATSGRPEAVRVRYNAGQAAGDVPELIKHAIALRVGQLYRFAISDPTLKKEVVEGIGSTEWDLTGAGALVADEAIAALLKPYRVWVS